MAAQVDNPAVAFVSRLHGQSPASRVQAGWGEEALGRNSTRGSSSPLVARECQSHRCARLQGPEWEVADGGRGLEAGGGGAFPSRREPPIGLTPSIQQPQGYDPACISEAGVGLPRLIVPGWAPSSSSSSPAHPHRPSSPSRVRKRAGSRAGVGRQAASKEWEYSPHSARPRTPLLGPPRAEPQGAGRRRMGTDAAQPRATTPTEAPERRRGGAGV